MFFKVKELSVGYNGKTLINDINFDIERGKIVTLIGPNGAGKSTILKTITNHLKKIEGVITIGKDEIGTVQGKKLAKQLSVMLTDRINPELMTCSQLVAMGRYPYTNFFGKPTPEDEKVINESLEMVQAKDLSDRLYTEVSDGQRQRVLLARAICQQPSVLVLDEPTSYLDIRHKIELLEILKHLAKTKNVAIVLSLHEIELAQKISDYVLCVKGDKIKAAGTPAEVFTDEQIQSLYDMKKGSYDSLFGSVELAKLTGHPQIFVIAGGGYGIPVYRGLQKRNVVFSTGVLYANDVDYQIAKKLTEEENIVVMKSFDPITEDLVKRAKNKIDCVDKVFLCNTPIGSLNHCNLELLQYARNKGKKVVTELSSL